MPTALDELRQMNVSHQKKNATKTDAPEAKPATTDITSNTVSQSYDLLTDQPTDSMTDRQANRPVSQSASQPVNQAASGHTDRPTGLVADSPTSQADFRPTERQADRSAGRPPDIKARIKELAASSMTPVTLKMPSGINDFVDEYIHQNYKLKIKKQDVITRALQLAIYEIETGKELVKLDG